MRFSLLALTLLVLSSCATIDHNLGWNIHKTAGYNFKFLLCKDYKVESLSHFKDYMSNGLPINLLNKCVIKICKSKRTCTFHGKSRLKKEILKVSNPNMVIL